MSASNQPRRLPPLPGAKKKGKDEQKKPARSTAERAIVWGVIAVLIIIVLIEGRARFQYGSAMSKIQAAQRKAGENPLKIDEITPLISQQPAITTDKMGILEIKVYSWQWRGVFKTHRIELNVDDDNEITAR